MLRLVSGVLLIPQGVEVGFGLRCRFVEFVEPGAGVVGAVGAGGDGFGVGTLADFAKLVAVVGLDARGLTARAVDVFGFDGGVVGPRPFLGDFGAKGIVVVFRGDEGAAFLAIEAAISDHIFPLEEG